MNIVIKSDKVETKEQNFIYIHEALGFLKSHKGKWTPVSPSKSSENCRKCDRTQASPSGTTHT